METLTSTHPFEIVAPFEVKSMADGSLELVGYASTFGNRDKQGDVVVYGAFDRSIERFMQDPKMLLEHDFRHVIGTFPEATIDHKGLKVKGVVFNDPRLRTVREKIESGVYSSFSIGGYFTRRQVGGEKYIVDVDLREISVVKNPANEFASFTVEGALAKSMDYVQGQEMEYGAPVGFEHKSLAVEAIPPVVVNVEGDGLDEFLTYQFGVPVPHGGSYRIKIKAKSIGELKERIRKLDVLAWRTKVRATLYVPESLRQRFEEGDEPWRSGK